AWLKATRRSGIDNRNDDERERQWHGHLRTSPTRPTRLAAATSASDGRKRSPTCRRIRSCSPSTVRPSWSGTQSRTGCCGPWARIVALTESPSLPDDPHFATLSQQELAAFFERLPEVSASDNASVVVYGPGAALLWHDVLWYADLPKRYAEAAVTAGRGRNLGQPEGTGEPTTKRLFYIDWPILDRHRDSLVARIDRWIDTQEGEPRSIAGDVLRTTVAELAERPFRTRPTFNTTSWGGHWGQEVLGHNRDARNTAVGYELIAPESGVLLGTDPARRVEVQLQLIVRYRPLEMLGEQVHAEFGTSFPIRFDYLDTVGGGSLSVHCHPRPDYMRDVFG